MRGLFTYRHRAQGACGRDSRNAPISSNGVTNIPTNPVHSLPLSKTTTANANVANAIRITVSRASLYTKHQGLANLIARDYYLPGADMDDVHQEARVALWIATSTWNPERGSFKKHAAHAIRCDLQDKVKAANRHNRRVLTDAVRDERQLSLIEAPELERLVEARERLREAVAA